MFKEVVAQEAQLQNLNSNMEANSLNQIEDEEAKILNNTHNPIMRGAFENNNALENSSSNNDESCILETRIVNEESNAFKEDFLCGPTFDAEVAYNLSIVQAEDLYMDLFCNKWT